VTAEGLVAALNQAGVRCVVIGVAGANYWARSGHTVFTTQDFDLFLPPDPGNAVKAWQAAASCRLDLYCGEEPLDRPRDLFLAQRIIERRALVVSKAAAGREKDRLFLASHADALRSLIDDET
jgi:hypothetical protein